MEKAQTVTLRIQALLDEEAGVWVATSEDVPGLITESETLEALLDKLKVLIPELIALNGLPNEADPEVPLELLIQSEQRIAIGC